MSEELATNVGISALGGALRRAMRQQTVRQKPQQEFGTLDEELRLLPDSWGALPFPFGRYSVADHLELRPGDRVTMGWFSGRPVVEGLVGLRDSDDRNSDHTRRRVGNLESELTDHLTNHPSGDGGGAQGPPGPQGPAATINVGSTVTGAPGSAASVNNSGSSSAAVFNFVIPRGDAGLQGIQGPEGPPGADSTVPGPQGPPGADSTVPGPQGDPGQAATVTAGTTSTGAPGSDAAVANSGTSSAAVLDFTIPAGVQGPPGAGWVTSTVDPTAGDADYVQGTLWLNTTTGTYYTLSSAQGTTPAVWTTTGHIAVTAVDNPLRAYIQDMFGTVDPGGPPPPQP